MSIRERNNYLQILHKKEVSREHIYIIMRDIDDSGVFKEKDVDNDYDDFDEFENAANILFDKSSPTKEKIDIIRRLNKKPSCSTNLKENTLVITEERILEKQQEYNGLSLFRKENKTEHKNNKSETIARYGRSLLHEAIAYRNINFVKKCIKEKRYLNCVDNNGHTPMEMAYYEEWEEGFSLFV